MKLLLFCVRLISKYIYELLLLVRWDLKWLKQEDTASNHTLEQDQTGKNLISMLIVFIKRLKYAYFGFIKEI